MAHYSHHHSRPAADPWRHGRIRGRDGGLRGGGTLLLHFYYMYTVVTLLLYCCYTLITLPSHCVMDVFEAEMAAFEAEVHCYYTFITLLLHYCHYTVITLFLHCSYTVVTLLSHCCHTAVTLLLNSCSAVEHCCSTVEMAEVRH
jgi:hypothetical protein